MIAEEVVVGASEWLLAGLIKQPAALTPHDAAVASEVEAKAEDLIDEFRDQREQIAADARAAFALLGAIPQTLKWNAGLKHDWSALVLAAVHQSERFGDGTGALKRKFATDLVVRVLERYNFGGLPFLTLQKTLLAPFVGILIDWTVEILNERPASWPAIATVKLPSLKRGTYDGLLRIALAFSKLVMWINGWLFAATRYERHLRDASKAIAPEATAIVILLPPDQLAAVITRVVDIVVQLGHLTAPYVGLVQRVLSVGDDFVGLSVDQRTEVVFLMLRGLLLEAYADDPLVMIFIDSPIGDTLLRAVVAHANWVLVQNGLVRSF